MFCAPGIVPILGCTAVMFNDDHEYHALKETLLPDSCNWIFSEPEWEEWLKLPEGSRPILAVASEPGTGKSHMAAALHDKLAQRASEDETGHTCVAHFYFREQQDAFAFFLCGVITVINRIAETNYAACEKLNAQIARDDIDMDTKLWQNLVEHLLNAVFAPESKFNLFIVLDGLDELRDWVNFKLFLTDYFNDKGLKISLVVTSRPEKLDDLPEGTKLTRIEATKKKQMQDLRALIWSEINSLNNIRRFSRYVQQRIADNIEKASPNMLYAQHLLGRLEDLECQRRMPPKHQEVAAALLHWVAFAKRLLTLAEVQSLVKYLAQDNEFDIEEIRELFDKFLRIGGPGYDTEVLARLQASKAIAIQDLKQDDDDKHDSIYDDGPLPVTFKERSMRHYFTNSTHGASDFRWGSSEANRKMLVTSADLLKRPREAVCEGLLKYAALWFISHFTSLTMDRHAPEEQAEVLEAFGETMADKTGLAEMMAKSGILYGKRGGGAVTNVKVAEWAGLLDKPEVKDRLSDFAVEWWQRVGPDPAMCRVDIAKGYLRRLCVAQNSKDAFDSWQHLHGVLQVSEITKVLMDQAVFNFPDRSEGEDTFDKDSEEFNETAASHGILNLFGDEIEPDAAAYRAVAEVLDEYELLDPAEKTCRTALDLCKPGEEDFYRVSCVMSSLLIEQKKKEEAREVAQTAVDNLSAGDVPPALKRKVYTTLARAQRKLRQYDAALESFLKAKQSDPDGITPGQDLVDELKVVEKKDKVQYIQMLKGWSLVERITRIASDYAEDGEERHAFFCDIASETGEQDFIVKFYEEAIDFLDNLDAALPLRLDLAVIYFEVCREPEFPILGGTALLMMLRAVDCMINAQLELFRKSRDPVYKAERLTALAGLMQRPFASDVPRTSASWTSFHRVGLAYMYLVMGPLEKFQQTIQSLLHDCFAGLNDSVGWNDAPYLWMLAQSLSLMSKALRDDAELHRHARIVASAVFSRLGNTDKSEDAEEAKDQEKTTAGEDSDAEQSDGDVDSSDDEEDASEAPADEGDLVDPEDGYYTCGGFCNPARKFKWWAGRSAYLYITFASGMICEECQAEYDAIERGEKKFKGRYFYGLGQDKLKLPVEGWRGVKNGIVRIEGQEDVAVDDFFKKVENEVVRNAWDRIWAGDGF
ncbi:hypothetical protein FBULB1_7306 [Fusarium bulbicola]|nr:hypothetical protein FBULB1_7306 [Fusarium bulbicola]